MFLISIFLLPNLTQYIKGLYGSFVTYVLIAFLSIIAILRVIDMKGYGKADAMNSLVMSVFLCFLYLLVGFFTGFSLKTFSSTSSLAASLVIFIINITSVEVARAIAISMPNSIRTKILLGVIVGLFYSKTIIANKTYLVGACSQPVNLVSDVIFSLIITLLHIDGGFLSAFVFRFLISCFWRFSPILPDKNVLGFAWYSFESLSLITVYFVLTMLYQPSVKKNYFMVDKSLLKKSLNILAKLTYVGVFTVLFVIVFGGFTPMVINSGSMTPTLKIGDIVLVRHQNEYDVGDIVAYNFMGQVIVHRIVDIKNEGFITKGDANSNDDPFIISRDLIIGKVSLKIPIIGWISLALKGNIDGSLFYLTSGLILVGLISLFISKKRS